MDMPGGDGRGTGARLPPLGAGPGPGGEFHRSQQAGGVQVRGPGLVGRVGQDQVEAAGQVRDQLRQTPDIDWQDARFRRGTAGEGQREQNNT